jgi:RHS repeat-associated protein
MTSSGTDGYTWDARNRLVSTLSGASFQYDPFGRRTSKTIGGVGTQFLYDGANPVQELSAGTPIANLLTGLRVDEVFTRTDAAGARNFLPDALGSALGLADSTGTIQTQYTYEPFGNTTSSGAASASSYQYTGRENDGTGLYYYRARYFSPVFQHFVREDPIRFNGGINLYGYVGNSPVNFVDPSGQVIGVAPGSGADGYLAYYTARLYLEQAPYANAIIQELEESPELYLVHVSDFYDYDSRLGGTSNVKWNPHKGGCTEHGGRPESPALLLLHELVHLRQSMKGLDPTDEEAVTQITNQVAAQLGEGTRVDYADSRYGKEPWPLPIPSSPMGGKKCRCR